DRNATTDDLRRTLEEASGQELAWFFDEWLRRPASPSFDGSWHYDAAAGQIVVEVNQTQAGDPYRMPVEIGIVNGDRPQAAPRLERVTLRNNHDVLTIDEDRERAVVTCDPNILLRMDRIACAQWSWR